MNQGIRNLVTGIGIFSTITLIYLMLSSFKTSTSQSSGYEWVIVGDGNGLYKVKFNRQTGVYTQLSQIR